MSFVQRHPLIRQSLLATGLALAACVLSAVAASPADASVSAIAFERGFEIWVIPAAGGEARLLIDNVNGPDFSPNGQKIAFFGSPGIVAADFDGTNAHTVRAGGEGFSISGGIDYGPGGLVAWAEDYDHQAPAQIRVVNSDGSGLRTVFTTSTAGYSVCCPAFSPDGGRIVFKLTNTDFFTPDEGLWTVHTDGSDPSQLTSDFSDSDPVFSPDGSRIAFRRIVPSPGGGEPHSDVFVMNADGTGAVNLTNDPSRDEQQPTYSPAGDMLAFSSFFFDAATEEFNERIDVIRADGTGRRALTAGLEGGESNPTWANIAAIPAPGGGGAAQPVAGKTFNATPASGLVRFKCGHGSWTELNEENQLAIGCRIDTRGGTVRIVSAANRDGSKTQSGKFRGGIFKVKQEAARRPVTELALVGKLRNCTRHLKGDADGRFRTRGRYSTATVSNSIWIVKDTCDGTLTKVRDGKAKVRDLVKDKTIKLSAGERYLAKRRAQ